MPVEAQANTYTQPTGLSSLLGAGGGIIDFLRNMGLMKDTTDKNPNSFNSTLDTANTSNGNMS
jgi:hypothetical protein